MKLTLSGSTIGSDSNRFDMCYTLGATTTLLRKTVRQTTNQFFRMPRSWSIQALASRASVFMVHRGFQRYKAGRTIFQTISFAKNGI